MLDKNVPPDGGAFWLGQFFDLGRFERGVRARIVQKAGLRASNVQTEQVHEAELYKRQVFTR